MTGLWNRYRTEYNNLLRLGLPILVTQLGVIIVTFADTMMVGAYGVDELAAAAFVNSLFVIVTVMQIGFAAGLTPLIGALYGRGDSRRAGLTARAGVEINIAVSLVLTALMCVIYFFLADFGQPEELLPIARSYYLIIMATLLPMAVFNSFQQISNGINDTATPMWIILGANILNIIGNYLLIFGKFGFPEMGLAGAGISTLFARFAGATAIAVMFFRRRRYKDYADGFRCNEACGNLRRQVWTTSYPVMIQSGIECSMWSFGAVVCGWFSKIQLAAYQVVNTMSQLGFMTFISFATATSIRVSNFMGIGDISNAKRITAAGLHFNLVLATIASLIFLFGGKWIIGCFTPSAEVIECALTLIIPLVVYQYMDATQLTYVNALRGTSRVKPLLWISVICYAIIGIPVMLWFACGLGLENVGVYYSYSVSLAFAATMATIIFYRTLRKSAANNDDSLRV